MTTYINTQTLEYPLHAGDIELSHAAPEHFQEVQDAPMPEFNKDEQMVFEQVPECREGVWTRVWGVRDLTQIEKDAIKEYKKLHGPKEQDLTASGSEPDVIG